MLKFAVFGNPIVHSISPLLHNYAIKSLNLNAFYGRVKLSKTGDLNKNLLDTFNALDLKGANITLPFKEVAFKICDELCEDAKKIGSVNTIVKTDGKLYGYNTDAQGFFDAASKLGKFNNALIIGAGGTTKAISYILNKHGIKFDILNRSHKNVDDFKCENFYIWDQKDIMNNQYDLIINSTSAGLDDDNLAAPIDILNNLLPKSKFAFDVIYGIKTPFLSLCEKFNIPTKDGLDMLIGQGALAFELFFNKKFKSREIYNIMEHIAKL